MDVPGGHRSGAAEGASHHGRNSPSSSVCYARELMSAEEHRSSRPASRPLSVQISEGEHERRLLLDGAPHPGPAAGRYSYPQNPTIEQGYFAPKPVRLYHTARLPSSAPPSGDPSPAPSLAGSTASLGHDACDGEHVRTPSLESAERPAAARDPSSAAAGKPPVPGVDYYMPKRPHREYPNQAYSALHSQIHPVSHHPPYLRTRSAHPSQLPAVSQSQGSLALLLDLDKRSVPDGSRTAGYSPASSPGLFAPATPPIKPTDECGSYSSPYLHWSHRQQPKETHIADVDVDPISGRKIINQYEIIDELGRGVHGKVKLGRSLHTGQYVAIKIVERFSKRRRLGKNNSHEDKIKREIAILKKARHPNIVGLLEVIDDPSRKKVYIVLEHVEMGEVKWRTEGAHEIALVTYRRLQRAWQGIPETEDTQLADEDILRQAKTKRDRDEQRRLKEHRRQRSQGAESKTWSFEHGGDEEDLVDDDCRSRASTAGTDEGGEHPGRAKTPAAPAPPPYGSHDPTATASRQYDAYDQDEQLQTIVGASAPRNDTMITGLEGTMYGPYEPAVLREPTPSVTDNIAAEYSHIPDPYRYVPLMTLHACRAAFRDTVLGLEYLHYQGVIHRDIKPANLLQTKDHRIKISDFGVSYLGRGTSESNEGDQSESDVQDVDEALELAKTVGTPAFYAPELCQADSDLEAEHRPVGGGIDVWALGVTLFCLVFGRIPFYDPNTFVLMRRIAEDEVFIPRTRLRAVDEHSISRRNYVPTNPVKRAHHEFAIEAIDDELYDLLCKLLTKDPRKRISLLGVKHHPWVLLDLPDPRGWLDETDPARLTQGKRIEVNNEEINEAVVPINILDRFKSGLRKIGGAMGFGKGTSTRKRAKSSVNHAEGPPSTASSSSTISQDARRPSMRGDESISTAALRQSREDHPLSRSVTTSPEPREPRRSPRPSTPSVISGLLEHHGSRPSHPERAASSASTTGSIRTIRQRDFHGARAIASPGDKPGFPGAPLALDAPGGPNIGGLLGAGRRTIKAVGSRERGLGSRDGHDRAKSIDRLVVNREDAHGEPSLGLSGAVAAGRVDLPPALQDDRSSSGPALTSLSPIVDLLGPQLGGDEFMRPLGTAPMLGRSKSLRVTSVQSAKEEQMRRRILEDRRNRARPLSVFVTTQRPASALGIGECPPSPDDELFARQQIERGFALHQQARSTERPSSIETSPISKPMTPCSSEDQIFSAMSQSTSNPSIPSVTSANSSVVPDDGSTLDHHNEVRTLCSDDTMSPRIIHTPDDNGYDGDHATETGDDEDDSEDEDFIQMTRHKSKRTGLTRSDSISNAQLSRHRLMRESRSNPHRRSGSNGSTSTRDETTSTD